MIMNETMKTILARRSTKAFLPKQITDEQLETILEAGKYAPCGRGLQGTKMVVVQNAEMISKLSKMNADIMGASGDPFYGAPTYVVVFGDDRNTTTVEDASLVIGNMSIAAESVGVGACWIHRERQMFESAEGKALMAEWGVEDCYVGVGSLVLGYPAAEPKEAKPRKDDFVVYVR